MPESQRNDKANPIAVEKYLKGIKFPATKADLVNHAKGHDAPDDVVNTLRMMPDREFGNAAEVAKGVGEV
ncbi:MAG: DUF2795 domain-containing protein [Planctomycetota bacterium]